MNGHHRVFFMFCFYVNNRNTFLIVIGGVDKWNKIINKRTISYIRKQSFYKKMHDWLKKLHKSFGNEQISLYLCTII